MVASAKLQGQDVEVELRDMAATLLKVLPSVEEVLQEAAPDVEMLLQKFAVEVDGLQLYEATLKAEAVYWNTTAEEALQLHLEHWTGREE